MKLIHSLFAIVAIVAGLKTESKRKLNKNPKIGPKPYKAIGDSSINPKISLARFGPKILASLPKPDAKLPDRDPLSILNNGANKRGKYGTDYGSLSSAKLEEMKDESTAKFLLHVERYNKEKTYRSMTELKRVGSNVLDVIQSQIDRSTNLKTRSDLIKQKIDVFKIILEPTFEDAALMNKRRVSGEIDPKIISSEDKNCLYLWKHLEENSKHDEYFLSNFLKEASKFKKYRTPEITSCTVGFVTKYAKRRSNVKISLKSLTGKRRRELIHSFVHLVTQTASDMTMNQEAQDGHRYNDLLSFLVSQAELEFDYHLTNLEIDVMIKG